MYIDENSKKSLKQLGANIREIREAKQIGIKELSEKSGIRKEYLQKIENGNAYGVMIEKHLFKIANALNIDFKELFINL